MDKLDIIIDELRYIRDGLDSVRTDLAKRPCSLHSGRLDNVERDVRDVRDFRKWAIGLVVTILLASIGWFVSMPAPTHGGTDVGRTRAVFELDSGLSPQSKLPKE